LSLRDARECVIEAKKILRVGIEPDSKRNSKKENDCYEVQNSFEDVTLECICIIKQKKIRLNS
jgi:hypothetical protein